MRMPEWLTRETFTETKGNMTRTRWRYGYMSADDSELLDKAIAGQLSCEEANRLVAELLVRAAKSDHASHCASRY